MRTIPTVVIAMLIAVRAAAGDALEDTLRGGLLGAAAGALVSGFSDDDDARQTIPLFASIGALTGYAIYQGNRDRSNYYTSGAAYGLPYLALPYAWYVSRHPSYRYRRSEAPVPVSPVKIRRMPAPVPPVGRHPGVRLIPVPVTLPNGTVVPINILKLGDRYIGPRGEAYESMPDANSLRLRYHP